MDAATLTYDTLRFAEFEDFPDTSEPVWILGRKYSVFTEKDEILSDVASRLWFTYRKNFPAIGGTGPTSDTGWGCMLRCGQMIFAQALVCRHLGRDWRWTQRKRQPDSYFSVLRAFMDRKDSYYSIHQIAQMGVGEGKSIGQWYGPNTVAQVLKKLAVFDTWSALAVHIAMDNTVVMEDISCRAAWTLQADLAHTTAAVEWGRHIPASDRGPMLPLLFGDTQHRIGEPRCDCPLGLDKLGLSQGDVFLFLPFSALYFWKFF